MGWKLLAVKFSESIVLQSGGVHKRGYTQFNPGGSELQGVIRTMHRYKVLTVPHGERNHSPRILYNRKSRKGETAVRLKMQAGKYP